KRGALLQTVINDRIEEITRVVASVYEEIRRSGQPITQAALGERFRHEMNMVPTAKETTIKDDKTLLDRYQEFIDTSKLRLQASTLKSHSTTRSHLKAFATATGNVLIFEGMTVQFFQSFVGYLVESASLSNDSAWKVIKGFRAFLQYAVDQEYTTAIEFKKFTKKRMPQGEKSDHVYLTNEELAKVMAKDFSADTRLERARDLFVFQAHVGLRFSDLVKLREVNVQNDRIHLITQKNRKAIILPMLPPVRSLWSKYSGNLPIISNQKQNEYLKEVMKACGITTPVLTVTYRGAQRIEAEQPKYELIGTHTAKRTFVTILLAFGASIDAVMKLTGNTRRTIDAYALKTQDDAIREIEAIWK
ncbi:MAG: site-specific integrase, partial [Bacteroidota bacterium]